MIESLELVYLYLPVTDCCNFEKNRLWEKATDFEWLGRSIGKHRWVRRLFFRASCPKASSSNTVENIVDHMDVIKLKPQLNCTVFQVYGV